MPPLKQYLLEIADKVNENTTLDEVKALLSLYADVDEAEADYAQGRVHSQEEVVKMTQDWLK